jgi:hypothetical protein
MSIARRLGGPIAWIAALACAVGAGCRVGDEHVPFIVAVDTISTTPATIQDGASLKVRFQGVMGPNLCWMFERIEATRTEALYEATVWGRHVIRDVCPQTISLLDEEVELFQPFGDPFTVRVNQPDGSTLELVVTR